MSKWRVKPGETVTLAQFPTRLETRKSEKKLKNALKAVVGEIAQLQNRLYAENRQSLLILFQGMDSSGKDGAIKRIMRGINPQGFTVTSFKHPSQKELEHDYLWRHILQLPEHGQIAVFNRSHYENVLISKVHPELVLAERLPHILTLEDITEDFWLKRYEQIRDFEKSMLVNGTQIVKFFLHISKAEQRTRFLERIENRHKHWKFASGDIAERARWTDYESAYEQAFARTSTEKAPWHIIPADNKPAARLLMAKIILAKLKEMNPEFPEVSRKEQQFMDMAKKELENE